MYISWQLVSQKQIPKSSHLYPSLGKAWDSETRCSSNWSGCGFSKAIIHTRHLTLGNFRSPLKRGALNMEAVQKFLLAKSGKLPIPCCHLGFCGFLATKLEPANWGALVRLALERQLRMFNLWPNEWSESSFICRKQILQLVLGFGLFHDIIMFRWSLIYHGGKPST